jgi:hypothetical protein
VSASLLNPLNPWFALVLVAVPALLTYVLAWCLAPEDEESQPPTAGDVLRALPDLRTTVESVRLSDQRMSRR